jgi:FtsZ-binding cell division protein ZapB
VNLGEHKGDGIRHSMHLSAPKGGLAQMLRDPDGNWVPFADYAALQAENERLKTERDHYQWASINDGIACNERARENQDLENQIDALKAENERLRKAGDEMAEHFEGFSEWMENADGSPYVSSRLKAWLAAKGVQP